MRVLVKSMMLLFPLLHALPAFAQTVDVKIVLAVDASGSVDPSELKLQIDGLAAAFRNTDVQQAVRAGPRQSIAATVMVWSDAANPKYPTKWHILQSADSFEHFAVEIEGFTSPAQDTAPLLGGGTGIGDALAYAITLLEGNPAQAPRWIVDISGDGPETKPWFAGVMQLPTARQLADRRGIIVNGLAIEDEERNLARYYENNVIIGINSFVLRVQSYQDYNKAIIDKLLRELSPFQLSKVLPENHALQSPYH